MIEAKQLTRHLVGRTVVDSLSFQVKQGEVLGLLGPNGAGKTTTLKMLASFLPPSQGGASIMGMDIITHQRQAQRLIGYLPESSPFYGDMTVRGFLEFIASVRNYRGAQKRSCIAQAIERLDLGGVDRRPIETLSKGLKRRVGLAQAILHEPAVLILDEPTDGLDPQQQQRVLEMIGGLAQDRRVIISTHQLKDAQALCTHVLLIKGGRSVASSTPQELASRSRLHNAVYLAPMQAVDPLALVMLPGVARIERTPNSLDAITVLAKPGSVIFPLIRCLVAERQWPVERLEAELDCFASVYRQLMDEAPQ
ncbi:ABC transporter ATP-binding protein [Pseudomonas shahriarae]|uniref:ABC transporter ATP-binding protein n=1 Tax=Pseudomonas shahriarae TaxID=2745512 RepID=UPI002362073E|nr:ABC transporter ATP-binding protein [Pseudomonas shahriarae]MDD1135712.1 ABC transporter ATP-binding protein [Pseudomonas shahriarae]